MSLPRVRCFTWNIDRPEKVSRETVPPCFAPMFHMKQKCHPFGWHLSLSIKSVFTPKQQSRGSAHSKAFATQTHENRGRVPRFSYSKRKKVSVWELSDVRVLRSQNTDCRKNEVFDSLRHPFGCLFSFAAPYSVIVVRNARVSLSPGASLRIPCLFSMA